MQLFLTLVLPLRVIAKLYTCQYLIETLNSVECHYTIYWVIFVGGNFREKLEETPRIKFLGFKFCGAILYFQSQMT